jgi:hypothetical protein
MALGDKNIIITPNKGQAADPKIVFSGADSTSGPNNISLNVYPTDGGTLSFEGSSGQLFSITNNLSGSIFSVNDISGIPSIDVNADGTITLAEFGGNVGIGTATPATKLDVAGGVRATSISLGSVLASSISDTSNHLALWGTSYGMNVTSSNLNIISGASLQFVSGIAAVAAITSDGNLSWTGTATGNGSGITTLNATNISSGTIADARLPTTQAGKTFSTATQHASGTAALPGITFSGDTDTGMWRPGANLLAWSTNGGERLRVTDTGRVGIGTSSPAVGLHVSLTEGDNTFGLFGGTSEFNQVAIGHYNGAGVPDRANPMIYTTATAGFTGLAGNLVLQGRSSASLARSIVFVTGSTPTERLRITSTGNVGIGTSAPSGKLSIYEDADAMAAPGLYAIDLQRTLDENGTGIGIAFGVSTVVTNIGAKIIHFRENTAGRGGLAFFTKDSSTTGDNAVERMRITAAGNVGIGTSGPATLLHVEGTQSAASEGIVRIRNNHTTTGGAPSWGLGITRQNSLTRALLLGADNANNAAFGVNGNLGLIFGKEVSGAWTEHARITSAGNVGIGTSSPTNTLDVVGGITAQQVITTANDGLRHRVGAGPAGYGVIQRNDGTYFFHLLTNNGDANGTWNTLRPYRVNLANGEVQLASALTIAQGGTTTVGNALKISATGAIISQPNTGTNSTVARSVMALVEYRNAGSAATGAIVFIAPNTLSSIMHRMEIEGLLYTSGPTIKAVVQGYRTTGNWSQTSKINLGIYDLPVRWGVTADGRNCLILGDVATTWSYPHISVARAMFSHGNAENETYDIGWSSSLVTSLAGFTNVTGFLPHSTIGGISNGSHVHTQSVAATTWTVDHNLGQRYVNVEVIDGATNTSLTGTYDYPTVTFTSTTRTVLTFTTARSGTAVFNSGNGPVGATGPTGVVAAAGDGTAALPGITFAADTDTGIYRPTTNVLAITTGGVERLRVEATGTTGTGFIDFGSFRGTAADSITTPSFTFTGSTSTGLYSPGTNQVGITTNGTAAQTWDASGNANIFGFLGVGSASPSTSIAINAAITTGANANRYGIQNLTVVNDTQALTANRTSYGAFNRITSDLSEANRAGFTHTLYGTYNHARGSSSNTTEGSATTVFGSFNYADEQSTSTTTVANSYGAYNQSRNAGDGTVTAAYGSFNFVQQNKAGSTTTTAEGTRSNVTNTAGTITTAYLYRGVYSGTIGTKWGLHLTGDTSNKVDGSFQAGSLIAAGATLTGTLSGRNINPSANNTYDLGTTALRWRNIYTNDLSLSNGIGDYTIVEGEDDLFLYNNRSGKVFKFLIQEVDPATAPPKNGGD